MSVVTVLPGLHAASVCYWEQFRTGVLTVPHCRLFHVHERLEKAPYYNQAEDLVLQICDWLAILDSHDPQLILVEEPHIFKASDPGALKIQVWPILFFNGLLAGHLPYTRYQPVSTASWKNGHHQTRIREIFRLYGLDEAMREIIDCNEPSMWEAIGVGLDQLGLLETNQERKYANLPQRTS